MFNQPNNFIYKYTPILSIRPSEMNALEELPDKDKDIILPIIPLKGWVGSKRLENSTSRIEKAIGERFWVADIDATFIEDNIDYLLKGEYPREVFNEIEALLDSDNGYENWYQYLSKISNAIPTLQLQDSEQLEPQIIKLNSLGRGIVVRFTTSDINSDQYLDVINILSRLGIDEVFIVFDYGQVNREVLTFAAVIISVIQNSQAILPTAIFAISCSSFPSSFSGENYGENPIYERRLFNMVSNECPEIRMIYSDRGGARAEKIGGGGGIPSPRIDYPLGNDWQFIRKEFEDHEAPAENEKEELYTAIATELLNADYWNPNLHVWGTQVIELTSLGDEFGINSPIKATAVRINIHLHQQLYYGAPVELMDTDEDWED